MNYQLSKNITGWTDEYENALQLVFRMHDKNVSEGSQLGKILRYAIIDADFRAALIENPEKVIADYGVKVKAETINVVEDTHEVFHLVIPRIEKIENADREQLVKEASKKISVSNNQLLSVGFSRGRIAGGGGVLGWFRDDFDSSPTVGDGEGGHQDTTDEEDIMGFGDGNDQGGGDPVRD